MQIQQKKFYIFKNKHIKTKIMMIFTENYDKNSINKKCDNMK